MTSGFQQQALLHGAFTRTAPQPQNGKKADEIALATREKRSYLPRPPAH